MNTLTRLCAIGALSVLAACGSSTSSNSPADVSQVLASAAGFVPTYEDSETGLLEAVESEDGLSGLIGREDGTIVPLTVKIDREANTLTLTYGDEDPIVLTNRNEDGSASGWSNEDTSIDAYGGDNYFYFYNEECCSSTDLTDFTNPDDLPTEGVVGYTGGFNMQGADVGTNGDLALVVDFESSAVSGSILGSLYNYGEDVCCFIREIEDGPDFDGPSGDSFFGALEGAVSGGLLAASGTVTGTVEGDVSLLGGFVENGNGISGGIAGTIDDQTMGGEFWAGAGDFRD